MTLHLIQIRLDGRGLYRWSGRNGIPLDDGDLGYVVHAATRAAFGALGPQPFALRHAPGQDPVLLGYGGHTAQELIEHCAVFAVPEVAALFPPETIASKPMPLDSIPAGRRLGFEVRICPIRRQDAGTRDRARETDAFLVRSQAEPEAALDREQVYRDWLAEQLARNGAARIEQGRMTAFRRLRVSRRGEKRRPHSSEKPDATFVGELTVEDPSAFADLLARGVGRHRAFGFGMLLLRPPPDRGPC